MSKAAVEYRLAWRWLLPASHGGELTLKGFSREEETFWQEAESGSPVGRTGKSGKKLIVVNGEGCGVEAMPSQAELVAAQSVALLLNRTQARQWRSRLCASFSQVREYALLPPANPRVVVPLSSVRNALQGLGLHRPGRWLARMALMGARLLAGVGCFAPIRGRVLLIATRSDCFAAKGADLAGLSRHCAMEGMDCALYLGTPDDNRKTVVLPLGGDKPVSILKVAQTQRACASLENEVSALRALSGCALADSVPALLDVVMSGETFSLYQEYRPRLKCTQQQLDEAVVVFLGKLSQLGRQSVPLSRMLGNSIEGGTDVPESVVLACGVLRQRLLTLAESGTEMVLHRTHGDFAPWNCAWTRQGLFVFDWEESREQGLAFGDAFYFSIAPAVLVRPGGSPLVTLHTTLAFAEKVAQRSGVNGDDCRIYLALWLLEQRARSGLYGELMVLLAEEWK